MTGAGLRLRPAAKINLHLEILGRRADGYHELRTLLQSIDLRDELIAMPAHQHVLELVVDPPDAVAAGPDNLVIRAAERLRAEIGGSPGAKLKLRKRIPVGGGLGGGSADAAAALVLLNRLWGAGLGTPALVALGAELGADVPFFLHGGLALGVGRGDEIYPLPDLEALPVVVVVPGVEVPTAEVYRRLEAPSRWATVSAAALGFASGLVSEMPWAGLRNDLEPVVAAGWPQVAEALDVLRRVGGRRVAVTGSGAAVYAVMETPADAERAAEELDGRGWRVEITSTLPREAARLTTDRVPMEEP